MTPGEVVRKSWKFDRSSCPTSYQNDKLRKSLEANRLFKQIPAVRRGDYVVLSLDAVTAVRSPTLLSLPYGMDEYVPKLERVLE